MRSGFTTFRLRALSGAALVGLTAVASPVQAQAQRPGFTGTGLLAGRLRLFLLSSHDNRRFHRRWNGVFRLRRGYQGAEHQQKKPAQQDRRQYSPHRLTPRFRAVFLL